MSPTPPIRLAHRAVNLYFLLYGMAISCWAPMVPFVKEALHLDAATLGTVLLSMGVGSLVMMPISAVLIHRFGTARVIQYAAPLLCVFLPILALAPTALLLALGLFCYSLCLSALGIAMNTQAIEINKLSSRPILSRIHGIYSIGALSGAGLLSLLLRTGLPLLPSLLLIAAGLSVIALTQTRHLLPPTHDEADTPLSFRHVRGRILLLGGLCALLFMCEGSVLDWSGVFLRQYRDFDVSLAGLGYTAFAVMMTIARFTGDRMVMRFGEEPMLRYGVLTAIAGLLTVIILPWQASGLIGFGLVGFGIANTVPIVFAASGRVSNLPAKIALPLVTMLGCGGVLFGPVLIGYIAQLITLPLALAVLATMLLLVAWQAKAIRA